MALRSQLSNELGVDESYLCYGSETFDVVAAAAESDNASEIEHVNVSVPA